MTTTVFKGDSPPVRTVDDLIASFRAGEKPREAWRIGTEHEKIGFYRATRLPVPYEGEHGIRAILDGFVERFGWQPVMEGDNLVALLRGQASITLEPGGQVELSGAVLATAHEVCSELVRHLREIQQLSDPMGIVWLALGRNPFISRDEMPWVPKERYGIMRRYMPKVGTMGLDMMVSTGTVQTNFDYGSEADMACKLRVGLAASPILNAMFANSPFEAGRPSGYLSSRAHIWANTDAARTGIVAGAFEERFGYRDYVEYALDVPMYFIHRGGHYLDYTGHSFREFMAKGFDGHEATEEDWALHLTTLFPEVRVKSYIELRMCDSGPRELICALAAITRGLFYDPTALDEAFHLLRDVKATHFPQALDDAARWGLEAALLDRPLREWARDLLTIVSGGLKRLNAVSALGRDERIYLAPLESIVKTGKSRAAHLMDLYHGAWHQSLDPLFTECYFH